MEPTKILSHLVFDGKNFTIWKKRIELALRARDLSSTLVSSDSATQIKRDKALDFIVSHLKDNILLTVVSDSPYDLMEELVERYGKRDAAGIVQCKTKLANLRLVNFTNAEEYCDMVTAVSNELKAAGEDVSNEEQFMWLVNGLPKSLDHVRAAAMASLHLNADVNGVRSLIISEALRLPKHAVNNEKTPSAALSAATRSCFKCGKPGHIAQSCRTSTNANATNNRASHKRNDAPNPMKCFRCNIQGHIGKNCPKYGDNSANPRQPKPKETVAIATGGTPVMLMTQTLAQNGTEFFLDSGANRHLTNIATNDNVRPNEVSIRTATKKTLLATAEVDLNANADDAGFLIKDALYSADAPCNLLGVRPITKRGNSVHFYEDEAYVRNPNGDIILRAHVRNEMYTVLFNVTPSVNAYVTQPNERDKLWHRRLGHVSPTGLRELVNDPDVGSNGVLCRDCDVCCQAKQIRNSYDEVRKRATRPLELVHTDLIGPIEPSVHGERYVVTFLDDYTHYAVSFVLHEKSNVAERFEEYEKMAAAKFNSKIATLRCDNALEIVAGKMKNYCVDRGIVQQPAEPYEHQHNGRIERFNRTVMERTRALLYECGAPNTYWSFALYTAIYLLNRTPSSTINNATPYEKWFGMKPTFKHLRVFGSTAHVLIPYEKRTKLQPKSRIMQLVGFSDTGYLVLDPTTNETLFSSNVTVDESRKWPTSVPTASIFIAETLESSEVAYDDAIKLPEWRRAIDDELSAMQTNNVWKVVEQKENNEAPVVDTRWTFKLKTNSDGTPLYKARLCARGFKDKTHHELAETYAPVIKIDVLRAILVIAAKNAWFVNHIDVTNAFLNSDISYELYLRVQGKTGLYRALKEIYGLRTSAQSWYNTLARDLERLDFKPSRVDPCIFLNAGIIIVVYVDDILLIGSDSQQIKRIISKLKFKLKDLGEVRRFLGIEIDYNRNERTMKLSQAEYIKSSLTQLKLADCNAVATPLEPGLKIESDISEIDPGLEFDCRSMIGRLIYVSGCIRPDISYAVNYLSRFQTKPTTVLVKSIKRIWRYLRGTTTIGLEYTFSFESPTVEIYADSDYAGDLIDRRSTSGLLVKVYGNVVAWITKKQRSVTMSTAEAEYLALSLATTSFYGWKNCLTELGQCNMIPAIVYCDSTAAIAIAQTNESRRTRHVDVAYHNTRDAIKKGDIVLKKVDSNSQLADFLTKNTSKEVFLRLRNLLPMVNWSA